MAELNQKDIKEMKGRIDELFEYETSLTDDEGEMEALTIFNAAVARLSNYYEEKSNICKERRKKVASKYQYC